jgi:hypothetical protein
MSGEDWVDDTKAERINSLVRFGFDRADIEGFLAEHDGAHGERLTWLEDRRDTSSALEDRLVAFSQYSASGATALEHYKQRLNDAFTIEETFLELERELRALAPWEPPLNREKETWFDEGHGEVWTLLYQRLAALDVSSHAAVAPLHRLFISPLHADELLRHLELVETDEQRQRQMIQAGAEDLRELGYAAGGLVDLPLLESLNQLEQWQRFHAKKEQVRLNAVQMIQPFDAALAAEFELRCSQLLNKENEQMLSDISTEVHDLAQALEERRLMFSDRLREWRRQGIVFPHEGDLHPSDLMEWEANHDAIAASVEHHLKLVERWTRFARYWPTRTEESKALVGHLEKTEALQDVVDELDTLWKKIELDGLELLQTYEHAGLAVGVWQQRVFEDPLNALERMTAERHRWDRRVELMEALDSLDTSFSGDEEVLMRRQLLALEELQDDVLEEMEGYIEKINRRNGRHRLMLEEELATMRRSGVLERESMTSRMNLRELEHHVAELTRTGGAARPSSTSTVAAKRIQEPLVRELIGLRREGWSVDAWMDIVEQDPVRVARELSDARPHLEHHDVLRRRLAALPWECDVGLALEVEMQVKDPSRLDHLSRQIPNFTAHLAGRTTEDASYRLHLWQPERTHPTLIPIPEHDDRPVLQPVSALDEAHEAMLEAMDGNRGDVKVDESEERSEVTDQPVQEMRQPREEDVPSVETNQDKRVEAEAIEELEDEAEAVDLVEEVVDVAPLTISVKEEPSATSDTPEEAVAEEVVSGDVATQRALDALGALIALMGLSDLAAEVAQQGMAALPEVRRGLAQHVNVAPRDVRIARLLRLSLRLLPEGNKSDAERARMLAELGQLIAPLKRWMRRRLEARHSGARGDFLADAVELGTALERIPGLGRHLPLEKDDWPLPSGLEGLSGEIKKLSQSVNLPSAGGVKA